MRILFLGKRFYTNRDAVSEKFGRIYQVPLHWSRLDETVVRLWLLDYHTADRVAFTDDGLEIESTPPRTRSFWTRLSRELAAVDKEDKVDAVVASGDAYIGLLGYLLAKRNRARFVFDVYDKYDEFSAYRRPAGWDLFGFLQRRADLCFFASSTLRERSRHICKATELLANGVDTEKFRSLDLQKSREALALPLDARYVGYFGSMEPDRGVEDLLEALHLLREQGLNTQLLIGGKCPPELNLERPGVRYLGNVPFEKMPLALASCDVLAVPYRRSAFMDAGASNKIAEALCTHRPIVTTDTPNFVSNFPAEAKALRTVTANSNDPVSLSKAIAAQLENPIRIPVPSGLSWADISRNALKSVQNLTIVS